MMKKFKNQNIYTERYLIIMEDDINIKGNN